MNAAVEYAAHPKRSRILGQTLKPLSIGRYRLMQRFNVAFVAEGEAKAGAGDLLLGVMICSHRCDEFLKWIDSPGYVREVRKWSRMVCPRGVRRLWAKTPDLLEKVRMFNAYIRNSCEFPEYWPLRSGDDAPASGHWTHGIEVTLRSHLGWTKEEIDEEPMQKAIMDFFQYAENQGSIRLMTEEEKQQGLANAAIFEQLARN